MSILPMSSVFGTFSTAAPLMVGLCQVELSGTNWTEVTVGNNFYLVNTASDGDAITEVLEGKADLYFGHLASARVVNGVSQGGINGSNIPFVTWIWSKTSLAFYKVIAVVNKDRIRVEGLVGANPITIDGIVTSGYNVKSLTINVKSVALKMYRYSYYGAASLTTLAAGYSDTIPFDIHRDGPAYFDIAADNTVSVNPYSAGAIDS